MLTNYGFASTLKRFFMGSNHEGCFREVEQHLSETHNSFCHTLQLHMIMDARDRDHERDDRDHVRDDILRHLVSILAMNASDRVHELDMLKQAQAADSRLHLADVQAAIQNPSQLGVPPDEQAQAVSNLQLIAQDGALSQAGTATAVSTSGGSRLPVTLLDLQRCSWRIRSELLSFEQEQVKGGKMIDKLLDGGTFGDVYAATYKYCGTRVVVKKMKNPKNRDAAQDTAGLQALASFLSEVSLACALNHPNIVQTFGGVVDEEEKPPCWIVFERLDLSLTEVLPLFLEHSHRIARSSCLSLAQPAGRRFSHRSAKAAHHQGHLQRAALHALQTP